MSEIVIHRVEAFRARDVAGAVARIYRDAYGYADDEDARAFVNGAFAKHATWPEFLLLIATLGEIPVGFIYGYESRPGQWWHEIIRPVMSEAGYAEWQEKAFELAEIAVDPAVQGRGIGSALIAAFLAEVAAGKVLLSADMREEDRARDLYRQFGFIDLLQDFRYPGFDDHAIIMGRRRNGT